MPGQKDPAARGDVLVDGEDVTATVQSLTADINMTNTARKTEAGHVYRVDLNVNGLYFGCVAEVGEKDEKYNDTDIYFLDPQNKLLRQSSTMTHEGERTFDLSKGTPVTLADLTAKKIKRHDQPVHGRHDRRGQHHRRGQRGPARGSQRHAGAVQPLRKGLIPS